MKFRKEDLLSTVEFLNDVYQEGYEYITYPRDRSLYTGDEIMAFYEKENAERHAMVNGDWYVEPIEPFLKNMVAAAKGKELPEIIETGHYYYLKDTINMNKNNLENLRGELKALKFDDHFIKEMEEKMELNLPSFEVKGRLPSDKGQLDVNLHFKQSSQSDYYYFNRYDLALSKAKPLEEGLKYFVISKDPNSKREIDSPTEAIDYFKSKKGNVELAISKDLKSKTTLATMKDGKVDFVEKEFAKTYYSPALTNSLYVDKGVGFNVVQSSNMLQGRAVYRDDMVSRAGERYKAWSAIDFKEPKDKYGNYKLRQYNENYGFDLGKELENYKIKELDTPEKLAAVIAGMKDGNRPIVTVEGVDGKDNKMRIEAVPRYGNVNFFELSGKPLKREDFQKEQKFDMNIGKEKGQSKNKEMAEGLGM